MIHCLNWNSLNFLNEQNSASDIFWKFLNSVNGVALLNAFENKHS